MKLLPALCLFLLLSSCNLMQRAGFEKRRYQPGFYHAAHTNLHPNNKTPTKTSSEKKSSEYEIANNVSVIKHVALPKTKTTSAAFAETKNNAFIQKNKKDKHPVLFKKQVGTLKSIKKTKQHRQEKTIQKLRQKQSTNIGCDALVEALVIVVFTIVYYLIALCLMAIFPMMSQSTALGLAVIIMLVAIILLFILLSRK